jgi:long-subunit acyl-CoA synthetase (AMP-forming)
MDEHAQNMNQLLLAVMEKYAGLTCFQIKQGRRYQNITYYRFNQLVLRLTKYFHEAGLSRGQRVILAADNSLEWMVVYMACLLSGGVVVPLRTSMSCATLVNILRDSEAAIAVLQNQHCLNAAAQLLAAKEPTLPHLNHILTIAGSDFPLPSEINSVQSLLVSIPPLTTEEQQQLQSYALASPRRPSWPCTM